MTEYSFGPLHEDIEALKTLVCAVSPAQTLIRSFGALLIVLRAN